VCRLNTTRGHTYGPSRTFHSSQETPAKCSVRVTAQVDRLAHVCYALDITNWIRAACGTRCTMCAGTLTSEWPGRPHLRPVLPPPLLPDSFLKKTFVLQSLQNYTITSRLPLPLICGTICIGRRVPPVVFPQNDKRPAKCPKPPKCNPPSANKNSSRLNRRPSPSPRTARPKALPAQPASSPWATLPAACWAWRERQSSRVSSVAAALEGGA
jgi:hypothetical protein